MAIRKTVSGLAKLLHPDGEISKDEVLEYIELAMECRRRVKEQHPELRVIPRIAPENVEAMLDAGAEGAIVSFAEESAMRQILSDRMAEIQATRVVPDAEKEFKIKSSYGMVKLIQKSAPAPLTEPDNTLISGINFVTLTAYWQHAGVPQSKQIQFYVYRSG